MSDIGWISVSERLPDENGTYKVKIERPDESQPEGVLLFQANRIFYKSQSGGEWFGGCRPFTDNDTVTFWLG